MTRRARARSIQAATTLLDEKLSHRFLNSASRALGDCPHIRRRTEFYVDILRDQLQGGIGDHPLASTA